MKKEELKKDFNKYLKSNEEVKAIYKELKEKEEKRQYYSYQVHDYLKDHTIEEAKEHFKAFTEEKENNAAEEEALIQKKKRATLENNLLYNNFIYSLLKDTEEKTRNIINKYEGKNIGEKTKEKIQEEVKAIYKDLEIFKNAEIYPYFHGDYRNNEISLEIREKEKETYIYDIRIKFEKKTYNNSYTNNIDEIYNYTYLTKEFSYNYYNIKDLLYLENVKEEVKRILKEEEKAKNKYNKLVEQLKEEVKHYNNFIGSYNLDTEKEDNYKIKYSLNLY